MKQRPAFIKLRTYADNQAFTPDQIRNASWSDVESHLGLTEDESEQFWHFRKGMKGLLDGMNADGLCLSLTLLPGKRRATPRTWIFPEYNWLPTRHGL